MSFNKKPVLRTESTKRIELKAWRVLEKHKCLKPPISIEKIALGEGIIVKYQPFRGEQGISAVLRRDTNGAQMGVNSSHSKTRQRFSIAHELGHFFLHRPEGLYVDYVKSLTGGTVHYRNELSSTATDVEEVEANKFAAALLMPYELVHQSFQELISEEPDIDPDKAVVALAEKFDVSIMAMEFRLLNLELLVKLDD